MVTPLTRHAENPLVAGCEKPWEVAIGWTSVYRDPETGRTQLWYQCFTGDGMPRRTQDCVVCYAESDDGIVFQKPLLDLFSFGSSERTNIVLVGNGGYSYRYGNFVVVDRDAADPDRRYKMAYFDFSGHGENEDPGLCVAFSPDGIHWTRHPVAPLSLMAHGQGRLDHEVPFSDDPDNPWIRPLTMSDALDAMFDPVRGCFAIYGKMWINGPDGHMFWKHAMGRIESRDFVHWSKPQLLLTPDDRDSPSVEFHTTPVFHHAGCYFSLFQILDRATGGGVIDIELAVSRDGLKWERPFRKDFVLKRGPAGQFDSGTILTNATPAVLEDEIRFYFGGSSGGATCGDNLGHVSGVGLATIPRDRFAGLRPVVTRSPEAEAIGQVTLRPVRLERGDELRLNADATDGVVRVELLDEGGRRIRGFSREDAEPLIGDSLRHRVRWHHRTLDDLDRVGVMIRIHLDRATVYSLDILGR